MAARNTFQSSAAKSRAKSDKSLDCDFKRPNNIAALKKQGVEKLFTPGTPLQDIVDWLRKRFAEEKR